MVDRATGRDLAGATPLADPQLDLATPMKGPFAAIPVIAPDLAAAALQLARIDGILPAFFVRTDAADSEVSNTPDDIAAHADAEKPEKRREGNECVHTVESRGQQYQ